MAMSIKSLFFKPTSWFVALLFLSVSWQAKAIKHGDSFYIKTPEGKYLSSMDLMGKFDFMHSWAQCPKMYSQGHGQPVVMFLSDMKFVDQPDAGSMWTVRSIEGALGQELGSNEASKIYLQNTATGGIATWYLHLHLHHSREVGQNFDNESKVPFMDWIPSGASKHEHLQGTLNQRLMYLSASGNSFTLESGEQPLPHRRRSSNRLPIGHDTDANLFKPTDSATSFTAENIKSSPATRSSAKKIAEMLQVRGFKKLPGKGFKTFCHIDNNGKHHIFCLKSYKPGDGTNGDLYKLSDDSKSFQLVQNAAPHHLLRAPMPLVDIDIDGTGEIFGTSSMSFPMPYFTARTHVNDLHFGRFDFNSRWTFLPENNEYAYFYNGRPYQAMKHDGSSGPVDKRLQNGWACLSYHPLAIGKGYLAIEDSALPMEKTVTDQDGSTFKIKLDASRNIQYDKGEGWTQLERPTRFDSGQWAPITPLMVDLENINHIATHIGIGHPWCLGKETLMNYYHRPEVRETHWRWVETWFRLPPSIDFRQRYLKHGANDSLFSAKINQRFQDKELLMHDGTKWQTIATPTEPVCIDTDDAGTFWYMDRSGALYSRTDAAGAEASAWSRAGVDPTSLMGEPVYKFSIAGSGDNLQLAVISVSGQVGIGSGSASGMALSNLSLTEQADGVDMPMWGAVDANIASDGTVVLAVRNNDTDENGQLWMSSATLSSDNDFANGEIEAIKAANSNTG